MRVQIVAQGHTLGHTTQDVQNRSYDAPSKARLVVQPSATHQVVRPTLLVALADVVGGNIFVVHDGALGEIVVQ